MRLKLIRHFKGPKYTIGKLYIDDNYFCDTLEDPYREIKKDSDKIYGDTAIPNGTYRVILTESPRFKRLLPRLLEVPYFEGILIHRGNEAKDTHGCILVGENKLKGRVINSAYWEKALVDLLEFEGKITIEIE